MEKKSDFNFCKVFETSDFGQIVVLKQRSDDGNPVVRTFINMEYLDMVSGVGICSVALVFKDDDAGWDCADKYFNELTEEKAKLVGKTIVDSIKKE